MAGAVKLLVRIGLLLVPLGILTCVYAWTDPFEVLRPGRTFYGAGHIVPLNRDYVSTETYLRHPRRAFLDSFILGSSRSNAFRVSDWLGHVHSAGAFHYDASAESIFGIWTKVRFLHRDGRRFRNALILLDVTALPVVTDSPTHLLEKDPRVAGTSRFVFHSRFVIAFVHPQFFASYVWYRLTGSVVSWTSFYQTGPREVRVDPVTNDFIPVGLEREVEAKGQAYFDDLSRRAPRDLSRGMPPSPPSLGARSRLMLQDIAAILRTDGTDYRVVISPAYDRIPLHPADVAELQRIFGVDRLYNYSGANAFTNNVANYFEPGHFRAPVARAILNSIYGKAMISSRAAALPSSARLTR
jgi:hypothetical protein